MLSSAGNSKEIRNKSDRDADQYASESSKKPKTEAEYSQISTKKFEDQGLVSANGVSLDVRMCTGSDRSTKKRKLKDWQDNQTDVDMFEHSAYNGKVHKEESSESGFRKEKKHKVSKAADGKESSINSGNDNMNRKDRRVSPIILSGIKSHQVDGMGKDGIVDKDRQPRKHSKKIASQQALEGVYSSKKDLGSGHVSMVATSSSSKVSSSHKARGNFEDAKGSPVESVSSSPLRTSNVDKLTSAAGDLRRDDAVHGGFSSVSQALDANGEANRPGTSRKEKISSNVPFESHKFLTSECQNGDANHDFRAKDKPSFEVGKNHLFGGNVDTVDQHTAGHYYDEVRVEKNHHDDAFSQPKSGKVGSTLLSKDKDNFFTSDLERGKTKIADPVSEYSQKNQKYDLKVNPNHLAPSSGTSTDVKYSSVKRLSIKTVKEEKNHSREDYAAQGSNNRGMETQLKRRDNDGSGVKLGARNSYNGKVAEGCPETSESKSSKSKLSSHSESGVKREALSLGCQPVLGSEEAAKSHATPVDTSVNDKGSKIKQAGSASNKVRVNHSSMYLSPDRRGARDVNASSPMRKSSDLTASGTLQEAKELRDYADRLKVYLLLVIGFCFVLFCFPSSLIYSMFLLCLQSSGFAFESSEAYFQAALKFLQGAVLLEACGSENGRHGEMTQMQIYTTTAKLCE